jgi:hypothetical protein
MAPPELGDPKDVWNRWFVEQVKQKKLPHHYPFNDNQLQRMVWYNPKSNNSFQIKSIAKNILIEKKFKYWEIKIAKDIPGRTIILMNMLLKSPWYIYNGNLLIVDDYYASLITLFNGDLKSCIDASS